jgi:hypothetical protein
MGFGGLNREESFAFSAKTTSGCEARFGAFNAVGAADRRESRIETKQSAWERIRSFAALGGWT